MAKTESDTIKITAPINIKSDFLDLVSKWLISETEPKVEIVNP